MESASGSILTDLINSYVRAVVNSECAHRAASVGRVNLVHVRAVHHVVGHRKSGETMEQFTGRHGVNLNRSVVFGYDEQPVILQVKSEAVKVASHDRHELGVHGLGQLLLALIGIAGT